MDNSRNEHMKCGNVVFGHLAKRTFCSLSDVQAGGQAC